MHGARVEDAGTSSRAAPVLRGWRPHSDPQCGGCAHHAQRGGLLQERRAAGGTDRQAPGKQFVCGLAVGMSLHLLGVLTAMQAVVNPENTFYSVKRFVGRQPNEVEEELKEVSYQVDFEGQKVKIACPILSKKFSPEEISAQVLRKLSGDAGKYLSANVQKASKIMGGVRACSELCYCSWARLWQLSSCAGCGDGAGLLQRFAASGAASGRLQALSVR